MLIDKWKCELIKSNEITLSYLIDRIKSKIISRQYKKKFRIVANGLRIDSIARIHGSKRIVLGRNFSSGKLLWLSAITDYNGKSFKPRIIIGNNVSVGDSFHIGCINRVKISNNVLIGSRVLITDHAHGGPCDDKLSNRKPPRLLDLYSKGPIEIKENVWICDGVVIVAGVTIGKGSTVAANSVVTRDVPENCTVAGVPAKIVMQKR